MSSIQLWRKHKQFPDVLGQKGHVQTFTKIQSPATGFESDSPFFAGMIELENGKKVFGQIISPLTKNIQSGMLVRAVLRRGIEVAADAAIEYSVKWEVLK